MAYYAFDLDETLANVFTPFYMICSLRPILTAQEDKIPMNLPDTLTDAMRKAYFTFVHLVAEREASDTPLGILRPGLIRCFEEIQQQYEEGICKGVVFYSNNGSLGCLEFVRDVLHDAVGNPNLICECAHWSHPFRTHEIDPLLPGSGKKTWATLKRLLTDGMCDATKDIGPQDVMFFDDLIHPDLQTTLGPYGNYIQVKPYSYKSSITDVLAVYQQALREAGVVGTNLEPTFTRTIQQLGHPVRTTKGHFQDIRRNTVGTTHTGTVPPIENNGSEEILKAIQAFGTRRRGSPSPIGGKRVARRAVQQAKRKKSRTQQRGRQ